MKTFFTVFFAILAAAAVIIAALWAKARVDAWEFAWRSCEAQASSIVASHQSLAIASQYSAHASSVDEAMARLREASSNLERIQADQPRIAELEHRAISILEQKPFGLPLTSGERKELDALNQDVQKQPSK
jgi:hypothetical protein